MCIVNNKLFELSPGQELTLQALRKERADSPRSEMRRLDKDFNVDDEKFCSIFKEVRKSRFQGNLLAESLYRQAFVIKGILQENFWVFLHARKKIWGAFSTLVKELSRLTHPQYDIRYFKFLRIPDPRRSIEQYIRSSDVCDHDPEVRKDLISAAGDFRAHKYLECPASFLCEDRSMADSREQIEAACETALSHYIPNLPLNARKDYAREVVSLFSGLEPSSCGDLAVICIPKNDPDPIYYKSQPYGLPFPGLTQLETFKILQQSQREENPDFLKDDQYRIMAPCLDPKKHRVFILSPLSKPKRKQLKAQTRQIIENAVLRASSKNTCTYLFWRAVKLVSSLCGSRPK